VCERRRVCVEFVHAKMSVRVCLCLCASMMIAFITMKSSLVPLIEDLCAQI